MITVQVQFIYYFFASIIMHWPLEKKHHDKCLWHLPEICPSPDTARNLKDSDATQYSAKDRKWYIYVETEHTYDIYILLTYQIFVFAHISRIEEEYHITEKDQTKNSLQCFCLLKRFSTRVSKHLSMEEKKAKNLRGSNEQKVYISLHEFKVVDGRLVAQKSHHITCKSWKKGQQTKIHWDKRR